MNEEYRDSMERLYDRALSDMEAADKRYNRFGTDMMDYFPKGWESCYTYINENLLRLDNAVQRGGPSGNIWEVQEKFKDLLSYVLIAYAWAIKDYYRVIHRPKEERDA